MAGCTTIKTKLCQQKSASNTMMGVLHWLAAHTILFTVLVTAGVALLLSCCIGCSNCSKKDDVFTRHGV